MKINELKPGDFFVFDEKIGWDAGIVLLKTRQGNLVYWIDLSGVYGSVFGASGHCTVLLMSKEQVIEDIKRHMEKP